MTAPQEYPIADADLASRTPWFGRDDKPVRVGWYECRQWSHRFRQWGHCHFQWFDGYVFRSEPKGPAIGHGFDPLDQWRGRIAPLAISVLNGHMNDRNLN